MLSMNIGIKPFKTFFETIASSSAGILDILNMDDILRHAVRGGWRSIWYKLTQLRCVRPERLRWLVISAVFIAP